MRIIISHVYSKDNKGDAALLSVLISDIQKQFENSDITILTIDKIKTGETFENIPVEKSFMYWGLSHYNNKVVKLFYSFYVMGITLLWAYVYKYTGKNIPLPKYLKSLVVLYRDTDLIVPVGGGYLRGKPGMESTVVLLLLLHPLVLARIIGKPTINYAQSVGPFGNKLQEIIVSKVFKKIDCIIVREDTSYQLLKRLGVTNNVVKSIDSGFLFISNLKKDLRKELNISSQKQIVGITVRKWLKGNAQINYEKSVALFADYVVERYGMTIIFIPQVTTEHHNDDDRIINKKVYGYMNQKENVYIMNEHHDHQTIKAIYGDLDFTIGTRFHSVIFSLTSYVPAIAIEYEHKTGGIMAELDLSKWVIKIEDVTADKLISMFDQLVTERDIYRDRLIKTIPLYLQKYKAPLAMKQVYDQFYGNKIK